jgi:hypothetical protein
MTDVSYVPGDRTAIVGEQSWVLVDAPPDGAAVAEIWQRAGQPPTLDALLTSLLSVGLGRVPDFTLLITGAEGRRHLLCRGRATATVVAGSSPERIDGAGLATWREYPVPADARQVVLGEPPAGAALRLPAAAGVLLAGCVIVDLTAAAANGAHAAAHPDTVPAAHPDTMPDPRAAAAPDPVAVPGAGDASEAATYPDTVTLTHPGNVRGYPGSAGPVDAAVPPDLRGAPASFGAAGRADAGAAQADDMDYDFLWGATQMRTVEDAAVRPADEDESGLAFPFPGPASAPQAGLAPQLLADQPPAEDRQEWQQPPAVERQPSQQPATRPAGGAGVERPADPVPGGLIEAVPWAAPAVPTVPTRVSGAPGPATAEADDGFTVPRSQLPRPGERELAPDRIGPTVRALLCPSGHVNPPSGAVCRRCGAPLPQDTVIVPRPVLGVLRLSVGDEITLDRDVVMGRSPRADFTGTDGEERPHVVKLPSADGDISRTHLRVSLDGWHVLVTDLNSTNGTLVTLPDRDPEQLRPGEPTPIQPGTVVTLADGIDFRYEVTE